MEDRDAVMQEKVNVKKIHFQRAVVSRSLSGARYAVCSR